MEFLWSRLRKKIKTNTRHMYKVDAQTVSPKNWQRGGADLDELLGRCASLSNNIKKLVALL